MHGNRHPHRRGGRQNELLYRLSKLYLEDGKSDLAVESLNRIMAAKDTFLERGGPAGTQYHQNAAGDRRERTINDQMAEQPALGHADECTPH